MLSAISLALSEWGWRNKSIANFYLAPTRAWEFFAGSISAFIVLKRGVQSNNVLSLIGLTAIVFVIFAYNKAIPFPSVYTLVPVIGVILIILFSDKETLVAKLLSTKGFVGIGLISYSTYLFHQPMFAFTRFQSIFEPTSFHYVFLSSTSVLFGYLSWKFVEKPFRNKRIIGTRSFVIFSFLTFLVLSTSGLLILHNNGYPERYNSLDRDLIMMSPEDYGHYVGNKFNQSLLKPFNENKFKVLVVGDSHAQDTFNMLTENLNLKKVSLSSYWIRNACGIAFSDQVDEVDIDLEYRNYCRSNTRFEERGFLQLLRQADIVVLSSNWRPWVIQLLPDTKKRLKETGVKNIIVIGNKNFGNINIQKYMNLKVSDRIKIRNTVTNKHIKLNQLMRSTIRDFYDVQKSFCLNETSCQVFTSDGKLISYDGGHLTPEGAKILGQKLLEHELFISLQ